MGIYKITKLDYKGRPDFSSNSRTIEDTESKMFVKLANELKEGKAWGYYIYQSANRSGLQIRYLIRDVDYFLILDKDKKIIQKFRLTSQAPKPKQKPKTTAKPKQDGPGAYYLELGSEEPYYRIKPRKYGPFKSLKETYIAGYKVMKDYAGKPVSLVIDKNGEFLNPPRLIHYYSWYGCIVLSTYPSGGSVDYRLYSDGRLKKLTRADIKKG